MHVDELLAELEPLPFSERCRRLAGLRGLAGGPDLGPLLDELSRRGLYERSLAQFIAAAVRDEASLAHLVRTMRDPDAEAACRAVRLAVRYGAGAEAFTDGLDDAPAAVRAELYGAVRRYRRGDLADALIERVARRWGDREAAALLPACGPAVVAGRLDALGHAVGNWTSMGHAHPEAMLGYAERELAELAEWAHSDWWWEHGHGVAAAARHDAARVVGLLERHCAARPLPSALHPLAGILLDAEPERVLALLLSPAHRGDLRTLLQRKSVRKRLVRFGDDDLAAVGRAVREDQSALRQLLRAFPPSRREALFEAAMHGVDRGTAVLPDALLEVLPRALRHREARRMLGLRKVAKKAWRRRSTAAFLPYEEALPVLDELTRRPDADKRAAGYMLLIRCAGRSGDPATLRTALESFDRLRNEQDPVRQAALGALAAIPEGLWRAEHTAVAGRFADDALNARDRSGKTRDALVRIATALCRQGAARDDGELLAAGLELLERLSGDTGALAFGRLDQMLRRGQEHRLAELLAPRLEAAARRDDHRLALLLVRALHRRAHHVPQLQDALEAALQTHDDAVRTQAATLWLAAPGTRAERTGRILEQDPSAAAIPAVLAVIARERTDLLPPILTDGIPAGRFRRADVTYVPRMEPAWALRWTARQRDAYRALLERVADDADVPAIERASAIGAIARFPGTDAVRLRPYFSSADAYLRRVALTALPWTRSPQEVLPELLEHATSGDAHVAVQAAARAARFIAPSELAAVLRRVLADGRITARKEAVRILLRNRVPDALEIIGAAWDDPGQHPDVRAAIASALRGHLDQPVAWRILAEAAEGPRDLARQVLGAPATGVAEPFRERYAALVLRVARSDDPEARAAALSAVTGWAPWAPDAPALLAGLVTDLEETDSWRAALRALVDCAASGVGGAELGAAAAGLAAAQEAMSAEPERDVPALQRLAALADAVRESAMLGPPFAERVAGPVQGRLPAPLAARVAAATVRWDDPGTAGVIDAIVDGCAGLGVLAVQNIAETFADVSSIAGGELAEPKQVRPHAARLAARGDLAGGLFACALADCHGDLADWPASWRDLLRELRAHPDREVAFTAWWIHTAEE